MIKRKTFRVITQSAPIKYVLLFPNNYLRMKMRYPTFITQKNIDQATDRFGSKKQNLVVVELPRDMDGQRIPLVLSWIYNGDVYEITQTRPILCDGASSPVRIGQIGNFNANLLRGWYVHDILYGLFRSVPRRTADRIFMCFIEVDGTRRGARMIMMLALRSFGWIAHKTPPVNHWNYGRVVLRINGEIVD